MVAAWTTWTSGSVSSETASRPTTGLCWTWTSPSTFSRLFRTLRCSKLQMESTLLRLLFTRPPEVPGLNPVSQNCGSSSSFSYVRFIFASKIGLFGPSSTSPRASMLEVKLLVMSVGWSLAWVMLRLSAGRSALIHKLGDLGASGILSGLG